VDRLGLFFRQQFWRHIRHPALWVVVILTMIGARYFIPLPNDGYVTLSINNAYPVASSGVIGLQLGIIAALLLTPLAYIYLKAGPTRRHPWQIEDVTPSRRLALEAGQGLGDIGALFFVLFWIGIAGLILCFFRLPLSEINPVHLFSTLFLVAGPAMIMVVGVTRVLRSRPLLRGAWGDVAFFIFWMVGNVIAAALFEFENLNLGYDLFGFAASAAVSTEEPITAMAVGSAPSGDRLIELAPVSGFARPEFLLARFQWAVIGLMLCLAAAVIYKPRRRKTKKRSFGQRGFSGLDRLGSRLAGMIAAPFTFAPVIASSIKQVFKPGWLLLALMLLSAGGLFLPFRKIIGPGIFLVLIFMTSRFGAAWEGRHLRTFRSTLPMSIPGQITMSFLTVMLIAILAFLPAIIVHASATFARLLLLGAWYVYLNV